MNRRGLALWVYVCLTLQTGTRVQPRFAQLLRRDASKEGLGGGGSGGAGATSCVPGWGRALGTLLRPTPCWWDTATCSFPLLCHC